MWCMFLATAIINFFFNTNVSAFGTKVAGGEPSQPESYHCDHAVFKYSDLQSEAKKADLEICTWHQLCPDSPGPSRLSIYHGSLEFGQSETLMVWPLPRPGTSSPRHDDVETYFLILRENFTLQIVGVITRKKDGTETPCKAKPKEIDRVGVIRDIGFRCMTDYFPPKSLLRANKEIIAFREKHKFSEPKLLPFGYDGKALYNRADPLMTWPIRPDGSFHGFAPTFLVLNQNNQIVGMYERARKRDFRCKISNDATPKFVGLEPDKLQEKVIQLQDIIFKCGTDIIKGIDALGAALKAMEHLRKSKYELVKDLLPTYGKYGQHKINSHLYVWKIDDSRTKYSSYTGRSGNVDFYVILTDFCDVYQVMMTESQGQKRFCKVITSPSGKTVY